MQRWYNSTNTNQRLLMFAASICLIVVYGIGLIPLVFLLYCHFGSTPENKSRKTPQMNSEEYLRWANREGESSDHDVNGGRR